MEATFIIIILWALLSTLALLQYINECSGLTFGEQIVVMLIFIIGGPIFAANQILTAILDCIFPEGWDDDDDFKKY